MLCTISDHNYAVLFGFFSEESLLLYLCGLKAQLPAPKHHKLYPLIALLLPPSVIKHLPPPSQRLDLELKKISGITQSIYYPMYLGTQSSLATTNIFLLCTTVFCSCTMLMSTNNSSINHGIFIICILS